MQHYLHKELEEFSRSDNTVLDFLQTGALDGVWYWDLENPEHEWMSPLFWRTLGYDPSERQHMASEWQQIIDPDDRDRCLVEFQKHCDDPNHPFDVIVRYTHKNGSPVWGRCRGIVIRDEAGKPVRMLGAHIDVTALKRTEDALRHSEDRLEAAVEGSTDGLWDWDCRTNVVQFAPRFRTLIGFTSEEDFPNEFDSWKNRIHPDDVGPTLDAVTAHIERREPYDVEYRLLTRDGKWRWFRARGQATWDADGSPLRMAGSIQDVTDRIEAQQDLIRANEELQRSNAAMEEFSYTVSHDLKSPIVTIEGFAGFIKRDVAAGRFDRLEQFIDRISEATGKMRTNIDDLLELSRVGRVIHEAELVDTGSLVATLVDDLAEQISESGVVVNIQDNLPTVHADRVRMIQVFQNLLCNAIKYGRNADGVSRIDVGADVDGPEVRFFVADNGPGVPEKSQSRIFGLFQRLQSDGDGTGVGLAIVKRIAETHGGRVWVESEPEEGATFYFSLPVEAMAGKRDLAA